MSKLPEPQQPDAALPAAQVGQAAAASSLGEAPNAREADRTVVGTVLEVEREFIWIETEGTRAKLYASELMLDIGEVPADRYAPGDGFEAFVFQMEPDPASGAPQFSIRRAAPYLDALNRLEAGSVVANATVVNTYDAGIELDIDGVRGNAVFTDLPLARDESPRDRYQADDAIHALFIWRVDHDTREFLLSVKRNAPGYVEALNTHSVGEVVSATVTAFPTNGGLCLDVGGVIGWVGSLELSLANDKTAQDRYSVGNTIQELFVWRVNRDTRDLDLSIRRNTPGYVAALDAHSIGDIVPATVTGFYGNGGLWLEVSGVIGSVTPWDLPLATSEATQDHYVVGETLHDLFVWQVDRDTRALSLSFQRNMPGYVEALNAHSVGDVASAIVTAFEGRGLWLDVGGVIGSVPPWELSLADDEPVQEHYTVDETISDLFVWQVNRDGREIFLSVRRSMPGYVEALNAHKVGDVVSATIINFQSDGGLWLDVGGVIGAAPPWDLPFAIDEATQDHYTIGETLHDLFVWQVDRDTRTLALSAQRNTPGYAEVLNTHSVGDVVSATVTAFVGNDYLWLDVGGVIGTMGPQELLLADGETVQDRYTVGASIPDLFVWQVNPSRSLALSARRNAPGYVEAFNAHSVGDVVSGTIITIMPGGLWLDIDGAIGWIFKEEALLENDETLAERYTGGDPITAVVQHVDRQSRTLLLSARRIASALVEEPIVEGATIKALVVRKRAGGIDVSVGSESEIYVPDYALSLRPGGSPDLEPGQEIEVVVMDVKDGAPTVLSRRRALDGWEVARGRLVERVVVPNARIIPWADRPNHDGRAAIDLGPITGFIPIDELDAEAAQDLMSRRANTRHGIVIEELDEDTWMASVSETRFKARWQELVDGLSTNEGIKGEIVDIARGVATLDLGFGLLGEMSVNELPPLANEGGEWIGEAVTVGIRSVDPDEYRIAVESGAHQLAEMIADRENITCEFKAVFKGRRENEEVRSGYPVARAMAGMMNRGGGHVLVGVYEDQKTKKGVVIGWEESGFKTEDGFVNELSSVVGRMLTTAAGDFYDVRFETLPSGERIVDIVCRRADRPIFTKKTWMRGSLAEFFVRYDAATRRPADDREMYDYIRERF